MFDLAVKKRSRSTQGHLLNNLDIIGGPGATYQVSRPSVYYFSQFIHHILFNVSANQK